MTSEFSEQNNDTIFQEALSALRRGDKARAKELLTLLIKSDQNNSMYWIWLSATMDAQKERIYCLQTALKLDPENLTAKRGLILLGAMPPDETIQPFPMDRPRAWEEKLLLAHERPKERGLRVILRNPVLRLASLTVLGIGMCVIVYFGVILPRFGPADEPPTNTPGPSPTFTATPTFFGATAEPTKVFSGPTPLDEFLDATYTPTALYVVTKRTSGSSEQYRIAFDHYEKGEWDAFIENMLLLQRMEPEAADIPYYIGEAYRFKRDTSTAARYYNQAIDLNADFAPPYLGLARVRVMSNSSFNPLKLIDQALDRDPNLGEAYLERARYLINRGDIEDAFPDLELAEKFMPGSPEVYLTYARAYEEEGDEDKALEYAQKAYAADILNLPTYKLLGDLYLAREDYTNATDALRVYTAYEPGDATGFGKLGMAYYFLGEYENAVAAITSGVQVNPRGMDNYLPYRGLALVALGRGAEAVDDLDVGVDEEPQDFAIRLGYAQALYADNKFGSAFLQIEAARGLVETDEEKALELYWRARIQEQRNDIRDAIKTWNDLLKLDEDVMTPEMRAEAEARLKVLVPPTDTPEPTETPRRGASTSTPTPATSIPKPGATPTRTPVRTPSATPSAANTATP